MNKNKKKILLVEDNENDVLMIKDMLAESKIDDFEMLSSGTLSSALNEITKGIIALVLLDPGLPDSKGLNTITKIISQAPHLPVVVLTRLDDRKIGIEAIKNGAQDYLTKGSINGEILYRSIYYAIERRAILEEMDKLKNDLLRSNEELEQFAYVASHDLQEPIRMVASYMQLLEKRYKDKLDDTAKEFINFAVDGARRMHLLLEDLLELSRVGTRGKEFEKVDSGVILRMVLSDLSVSIKETSAIITYDELPTVQADPVQLAQLFQNLITNAIKYRSIEPPKIHISASLKNNEWLFSIKDNGIGFKKEHAQRIFVIFQRLHTREEYSGTGIGLAVCKKIVERHGGKIWAESEVGKGSTFYFTLPVTQKK